VNKRKDVTLDALGLSKDEMALFLRGAKHVAGAEGDDAADEAGRTSIRSRNRRSRRPQRG
jgi:hypothetical protein